jgi:hypothetical protein
MAFDSAINYDYGLKSYFMTAYRKQKMSQRAREKRAEIGEEMTRAKPSWK